jgi:hypothetical protein
MPRSRLALRAAFAAIAVLALALRLWHLELTTFGGDEAVLLDLAEDMVRTGAVPLSGPFSSVGLSTPAHFIYLIAPAVSASRDPTLTAAALAALGTTAVVLTMLLGWRAFGPTTGLLAGLLFAVNPTAVEYSRRIWQPGPLLLLGALLLLALDLGSTTRRPAWSAATFPIATLATLIHTSVVPLLPLLAAPLIVLSTARRWLALATGLAVSTALLAPFVVYEFQFNWKDYPNIRYYLSLQSFVDLEAPRWLLAITTGWRLPSDGVVPPPQRILPQTILETAADVALVLLVFGIALAIAALARKSTCRATRIRLAGLLLWLAMPVAFSIRHGQPLFLHYFFAQFPSAFLLMALPSTRFIRGLPTAIPRLALGATLLVATLQTISIVGGTTYEAAAAGSDPCFFPSIASSRAAAFELIQFGHPHNADAAIVELDTADAKSMAYLLRADFADVYLPHPVTSSQTPRMFGNVGLRRTLPSQSLAPEPLPIPPLLTSATAPEIRFDNGVALHDVRFGAQSGQQQYLYMALAWSVDASATSNRPVLWQVTLQTPDGRNLQVDSGDSAIPANFRGQSLVSWFAIDSRREVAPNDRTAGAYQLALELIDTFGDPPAPLRFINQEGTSAAALQVPVQITELERCPYPTTVP